MQEVRGSIPRSSTKSNPEGSAPRGFFMSTVIAMKTSEQPGQLPPRRRGWRRLPWALRYSWRGLRVAWGEPAFFLEALLALCMLPAAFWLGRDWVQVAVLLGSVVLVLVAELLNTAVEAVVDRIGDEWHVLSGQAKDLGSAAVLLTLLFCGGVWGAALWVRLG
ncbi:MAG: diacylglycerol kinase [Haliea sp.]|nr:diacylglycerol kinase [Haliea sp.]